MRAIAFWLVGGDRFLGVWEVRSLEVVKIVRNNYLLVTK